MEPLRGNDGQKRLNNGEFVSKKASGCVIRMPIKGRTKGRGEKRKEGRASHYERGKELRHSNGGDWNFKCKL